MATREQLQEAVILCGSQERQVEVLQQSTLLALSDVWQPRAKQWGLLAIQKLQQNAVVLDGLLESIDEGKPVELSSIPPTPQEYSRLLALENTKSN
jgi:myo-inositol catabolism protein IolC